MNPIFIILKKQFKDTFKNKSILIQFVMFPLLAVIMTNAISLENMPANFFAHCLLPCMSEWLRSPAFPPLFPKKKRNTRSAFC